MGRLQVIITAALIALAPLQPTQAADALWPEHYEITSRFAQRLLSRYPTSEYFYVTVGASLTEVTEFLRQMGPEIVSTLPLTSMRQTPESSYLTSRDRAALLEHIRRFLPSDAVVGGRQLLLVDFVSSGQSLLAAEAWVRLSLSAQGRVVPLSILGVSSPRFVEPMTSAVSGTAVPFILVDDGAMLRFAEDEFKVFREYPPYYPDPEGELRSLRETPRYQAFIENLRTAMEADEHFLHSLNRLVPGHRFHDRKYASTLLRRRQGMKAVQKMLAKCRVNLKPKY